MYALTRYMFARCESSSFNGCQALRVMSKKCSGFENRGRVRTRLLRKHLATTVQRLDKAGDEPQMVEDHMGHWVSCTQMFTGFNHLYRKKTKVKWTNVLILRENIGFLYT
ncbi:hypothetical protein PoB_000519400 [Plakobranchus ocellatus]|uniref:Uncharacterized protein n=1 Tax=Plakobranchus ocellatus TaxID=259542 RepID=A0AAV3Y6Y5_9GAST|nr:hypothetical protein PoB_000519400 [Plakobranchus ocellatus]